MIYDDYFDEKELEAMQVVSEIKAIAQSLVGAEIKERLERQEKRIAELEKELDFYQNFAEERLKMEREIANLKHTADINYEKGANETRKKRLQALADLRIAWGIATKSEYIHPKCNKCDDERYIHFKSPMGKDLTEMCSCACMRIAYIPKEIKMLEMVFGYNDNPDVPSRYYSAPGHYSGEEKEMKFYAEGERVWVYEHFKSSDTLIEQKTANYKVAFQTEEECQKYCDYLNQKESEETK